MRRILVIAAMSCALAGAGLAVADAPASADPGVESELAGMLNAHRGTNGLPPLQVSGELAGKASGWSAQMAAVGGISHSNLSSGISSSWLRLGENVGVTSASPGAAARLHNAWVNSPGHNANLLDPGFRLVGLGVFVDTDNGRIYATQVFMEPASQPAPSSPTPATGTPSSPGPAPAPAPAVEPAPPPPPPPAQLTMALEQLRHLEGG